MSLLKLIVRKKPILSVVVGATVFSAAFAFAASLSVGTQALGAGNAPVASCDTDGVSNQYAIAYDSVLPGYKVTGVTVTGIAAGCSGKSVSVTLVDGSNASLGAGTATIGGTSQLVSITPSGSFVAAASVANVHTIIAG